VFDQEFIEKFADAVATRVATRVQENSSQRIVPRWVDLEGAAQLMNTTKDAVRGMARAKLFPAKKMGVRLMFDVRDIERAFAEHTEWLK
jgi:hypothetical protein